MQSAAVTKLGDTEREQQQQQKKVISHYNTAKQQLQKQEVLAGHRKSFPFLSSATGLQGLTRALTSLLCELNHPVS